MLHPSGLRPRLRVSSRTLGLALLLPLLLLVLTGCALRFQGVAVVPSTSNDAGARAHFTVDFRLTDFDGVGGSGTLRSVYNDPFDPFGRVAFTTTNALFAWSLEGNDDNCMAASAVPYRSQSSQSPGSGLLSIYACDNGPRGLDDYFEIEIYSGPFDGYYNEGFVISGDFRAPGGGGGGGGGGGA